MDFSVGQILVEIGKQSWGIALCSGLFGAMISSAVTYFAIYKTSELDRDVRKYEYKVKLYYEKLSEVYKNIGLSLKANNYFLSEIPTNTITTYTTVMKYEYELSNYNNTIRELIMLNSNISSKLKELYVINKNFINMYIFLCEKILYFMQLSEEDIKKSNLFPFFKKFEDKVDINMSEFVAYYISENKNVDFEVKSKTGTIQKNADLILKEFSFDDKYKI